MRFVSHFEAGFVGSKYLKLTTQTSGIILAATTFTGDDFTEDHF